MLKGLTQHTKEDLRTAGVYMIINHYNNKVYIGSTRASFRDRWDSHITNLKSNNHSNQYLQHAWNKYGYQYFEFKIIEQINDPAKIIEAEQFYIDVFFGETCYNLNKLAHSPKNKVTKTRSRNIYFISPEGKEYGPIENISTFGREFGIGYMNLNRLIRGESKSYKGWIIRKNDYIINKQIEYQNILQDKRNKLNSQKSELRKKGVLKQPWRPDTAMEIQEEVIHIYDNMIFNNEFITISEIGRRIDNKITTPTIRKILSIRRNYIARSRGRPKK